MAANENKKYLIGPDEGVHLPVLDITHKVIAEDFGGAFTITEAGLPPGEMIPPHTHAREDECNFVVEGELTFDVGGEIVLAPAGSFVYLPRDVPHTFLVSSPEARFRLVVEPAGFEGFVREMSEPAGERTLPPATVQPPSPEQMTATAAKYGLDIVGPPGIPA